jgi:hypothetical protein
VLTCSCAGRIGRASYETVHAIISCEEPPLRPLQRWCYSRLRRRLESAMMSKGTAVGLLALLATPVFANEPPRFNIEATCRAAQPLGPDDRTPYDGCMRDENDDPSSSRNGLGTTLSISRHAVRRPAWGLTLATSRYSLACKCTAAARHPRYGPGDGAPDSRITGTRVGVIASHAFCGRRLGRSPR